MYGKYKRPAGVVPKGIYRSAQKSCGKKGHARKPGEDYRRCLSRKVSETVLGTGKGGAGVSLMGHKRRR